jgi:hypothetical protein
MTRRIAVNIGYQIDQRSTQSSRIVFHVACPEDETAALADGRKGWHRPDGSRAIAQDRPLKLDAGTELLEAAQAISLDRH